MGREDTCNSREDLPVYKLKAEDGTGKSRTLHRNLLMRCDLLPLEKAPQECNNEQSTQKEAVTTKRRKDVTLKNLITEETTSSSEDEMEEQLKHYLLKKILGSA